MSTQHHKITADEAAERLRGIAWSCVSVAMFTVLDTGAKYASQTLPTLEVVWFRYAFSVVFTVIILRPWLNLGDYLTRRPVVQILRATFLLASTICNFIAIRYLQLAEAVAIAFAAPLVVTALAGPVLGEWAGPRRWVAVVVGFIGVIVVINPQPSGFHPAALFSIGAALSYAGYALTTRLLTATESPAGMLLYANLFAAVVMAPVVPLQGIVVPGWTALLAVLLCGLMGATGHWCLIRANRHAPAPVLAPFAYTQIFWMILAGYLVFGDVPTHSTLIGAAIVISSGLYVLYRQRVHRDR